MEFGLHGKAALVAAASRGLGRATAMELAREGCRVALFSRSAERAGIAAGEIRKQTGAEVLALAGDAGVEEDRTRIVAQTENALGPIQVLVHNAGGPPPGRAEGTPLEQWRAAFETNLLSAVRLAELVLPGMKAAGWGRILTIASASIRMPIPNLALSNALRLGVAGWAKTLAAEVAGDGITVNVLAPGRIDTERVREIDEMRAQTTGVEYDEAVAATCREIPVGRYGRVEEFAALAAFLASERASYLTGGVYLVDGGLIKGV